MLGNKHFQYANEILNLSSFSFDFQYSLFFNKQDYSRRYLYILKIFLCFMFVFLFSAAGSILATMI